MTHYKFGLCRFKCTSLVQSQHRCIQSSTTTSPNAVLLLVHWTVNLVNTLSSCSCPVLSLFLYLGLCAPSKLFFKKTQNQQNKTTKNKQRFLASFKVTGIQYYKCYPLSLHISLIVLELKLVLALRHLNPVWMFQMVFNLMAYFFHSLNTSMRNYMLAFSNLLCNLQEYDLWGFMFLYYFFKLI